jgi:hypothetical protein
LRRALSGTVIAVVVVVVVVVAAAGAYFALGLGSSNGGTSSTTTSSSGGSTAPAGSLNSSLTSYLAAFNNRDVTTIKTYFTDSSKIYWYGASGGLGGNYSGTNGAGIIYGTSVGHTTSLKGTATGIMLSSTSGPTSTATYQLTINGVSQIIGKFNSTVAVTQVWVYANGAWTIQQDDWNYLSFSSNNPSQATVFPQWGLTLNGQPPSLAGEHVLEWNLAPYLAIGAYATIVAIGIAVIWVRTRKQKR